MAENKKSFLLYADLIHTVRKMPKEKVGELLLTILEYVNDEDPKITDNYIEVVFEPIKQQLKRDLQKYRNIVDRNKINGAKGGRPNKAKEPSGLIGMPKEPRKADSVTDTVSVKEESLYREKFFDSILETFYFKNFLNPYEETNKFFNHYESTEWVNASGTKIKNIISLAGNWEQKTKTGQRIPKELLSKWEFVYTNCKKDLPDIKLFLRLRPSRMEKGKLIVKIPGRTTFEEMEKKENRIPFGNALRKEFGEGVQVEYKL